MIVGISRLKTLFPIISWWWKATAEEKIKYGGAFCVADAVTSHYPEQDFFVFPITCIRTGRITWKILCSPTIRCLNMLCGKWWWWCTGSKLKGIGYCKCAAKRNRGYIWRLGNKEKWLDSLIGELWKNQGLLSWTAKSIEPCACPEYLVQKKEAKKDKKKLLTNH